MMIVVLTEHSVMNEFCIYIAHFLCGIIKCALQHFVGDFARLPYGAVHNLFDVTSSIHRCPQKRMSDARPQHRELHALPLPTSVWVL